jgi:tetratricopeptide (TPR) repeat protein
MRAFGENELFYAAQGTIYVQYIHFGIKKDESYLQKAEDCIEKIFALNPGSARGHYLKGFSRWWGGKRKPKEAVEELKKALVLDPTYSDAMATLAWIYAISGKPTAAQTVFKKALEVDPLSLEINGNFAGSQMVNGEFQSAIESFNTVSRMNPGHPWVRCFGAFLHAYNQSPERAYQYTDLLFEDTPQDIWAQLGRFLKFALQGDKTNALASVTEELKSAMRWNELYPVFMADCYALIDENEEAINWVEEAIRWGCIHYRFLNEYNPLLQNIRGEERFKRLMERVKYEWEHFEV